MEISRYWGRLCLVTVEGKVGNRLPTIPKAFHRLRLNGAVVTNETEPERTSYTWATRLRFQNSMKVKLPPLIRASLTASPAELSETEKDLDVGGNAENFDKGLPVPLGIR